MTQHNPSHAPPAFYDYAQTYLLGLNRTPRVVDSVASSAPSGASGSDAPFFFEDRRNNVFYVTTTETATTYSERTSYGSDFNSTSNSAAPVNIPPLLTAAAIALFPIGLRAVPGRRNLLARSTNLNGGTLTAIGSNMPVIYQGTTLYPRGLPSRRAAELPDKVLSLVRASS
jgi:hypothetical protein